MPTYEVTLTYEAIVVVNATDAATAEQFAREQVAQTRELALIDIYAHEVKE